MKKDITVQKQWSRVASNKQMEISWNFFFSRGKTWMIVNVIIEYWRASRCRSFTKNVTGQLSEKICFLAGSNPHGRGAVEASDSRTTYAEDCHLTGNEILGLLESWKQFLEVTGQPQSCWVSCSTPLQTSMAWKWQSCCPGQVVELKTLCLMLLLYHSKKYSLLSMLYFTVNHCMLLEY